MTGAASLVLLLSCAPPPQGEVTRSGKAHAAALSARIVDVDTRPIARLWYRVTEPAVRRALPPEPTFALEVENGSASSVYIYRNWLRTRYDANSKALYFEMSERPWVTRGTSADCKWLAPSYVEVGPHQMIHVAQHWPPTLGLAVRTIVVEMAWSDRPLASETTAGCNVERAAYLLSIERGKVIADAPVTFP